MLKKAITLLFGSLLLFLMVAVASTGEEHFSHYVDDEGAIRLPDDFRKNLVHMGSWFVPDGGASGFHDVYTEASTIEAYRRTGEFPDGATLVNELRAGDSGDYTTGKGVNCASGSLEQWFVMIKYSKGRFEKSGIWGSGWGWALYKPDPPSKDVASNCQTDCLGCHIPAQANDHIYVEAYPTLCR